MIKLSTNENKKIIKPHFKKILDNLNQIIKALGGFENNYDKKFNFSKLINQLELNPSLMDDIIYLLFNFQDLFHNTLKKHNLIKRIIDKTIFLFTEKEDKEQLIIPKKILMRKSHLQVLSDITYVFKFIKRGKGFDIETNGFKLLKDIKDLKEYYPYLFLIQENLTYLSPLGLELGDLLLSYNKSNKEMDVLSLKDHVIAVIEDE